MCRPYVVGIRVDEDGYGAEELIQVTSSERRYHDPLGDAQVEKGLRFMFTLSLSSVITEMDVLHCRTLTPTCLINHLR